MNIYKISQNVNNNWDTYDSFVVYAENEEDAKTVHRLNAPDELYPGWVSDVSVIKVEYLGQAKDGVVRGEILDSFNAG